MAQFGQSPLAKRISDIAGDINTQLSGGLPPDEQQVTRESPRPFRWNKHREDRFVEFLMSAEGISELEARSRAKLLQVQERGLVPGTTPVPGPVQTSTMKAIPQVIPRSLPLPRLPIPPAMGTSPTGPMVFPELPPGEQVPMKSQDVFAARRNRMPIPVDIT